MIGIPASLIEFEAVAAALSEWAPSTETVPSRFKAEVVIAWVAVIRLFVGSPLSFVAKTPVASFALAAVAAASGLAFSRTLSQLPLKHARLFRLYFVVAAVGTAT